MEPTHYFNLLKTKTIGSVIGVFICQADLFFLLGRNVIVIWEIESRDSCELIINSLIKLLRNLRFIRPIFNLISFTALFFCKWVYYV